MTEIDALNSTDNQNDNPASPPPPPVPLEQLEEQICELAAHLAAGTCRFLQLVAEFDARQGWASWDLPSCAAWLARKCQVAPGTAREQVRVARALASLPLITAQFAAGRMSYAKARALTRIATPATEKDLAQICGPMTAAQCERFTAAHRTASDTDDVASRAARRVSVHVADDGAVSVSARLPAAEGAIVLHALRAAAGDCEHPHRPRPQPAGDTGTPAGPAGDVSAETPADADAPEEDVAETDGEEADGSTRPGQDKSTCRASLADALVAVAGAYLSNKITTAANPDIYQVIVHVGPEALLPATPQPEPAPAGVSAETPADDQPAAPASPPCRHPGHPAHPARCHLDDGPAIAPAAAQAITCHATMTWMLHDHHGNILDAGRRHRRPPPAPPRAAPSANATTAAASSPAATPAAPTSTTSSPGPTAAPPA